MSPCGTPPHLPLDFDENEIEDDAYLGDGEPFEIVSDHSENELIPDDEEMEDVSPIIDDSTMVLQNHKESVFCVSAHPRGRFIVSGSQDHTAIIWDVTTGSVVFTCTGHEDSVISAVFSPEDGEFLATGDMAGGVQIWQVHPDSLWSRFRHFVLGDLLWLKWWRCHGDLMTSKKPNLLILLTGSEDGIVSASLVTNHEKPPKYLMSPAGAAISADVIPSTYCSTRPYVGVMYRQGEFRVWDLKTAQPVLAATLMVPDSQLEGEEEEEEATRTVQRSSGFICQAAPKSTTATDIVAVGTFQQIIIIPCHPPPAEENSLKKIAASSITTVHLEDAGTVEALEFSWTHPSFLAFGTLEGQIGIFDTSCMRMRSKWTYNEASLGAEEGVGVTALKWSQTEAVFFTATLAGTVVAWRALSGEHPDAATGCGVPLRVWRGHTEAALDIALTPPTPGVHAHHEVVVSASDDTTIRIFDLTSLS